MTDNEHDMFAGVESLLAQAAGTDLPPPAERARLRREAGLTQAQVATALGLKRAETVSEWESENGSEPRPPRRTAYAQLLQGLAARFPPPAGHAVPPASTRTESTGPTVSSAGAAPPAVPRPVSGTAPTSRQPGKKAAVKKATTTSQGRGPGEFTDGPLAVLDGDGTLYGVGGQMWECPATSVMELVEWTLAEMRLGAQRLHKNGQDSDPLVVLTDTALERFGLPAQVPAVPAADGGPRLNRLPDGHPVLAELEAAGWQLTRRGFGPWVRIYRPVEDGRRRCVQLAIPAWDALEDRAWGRIEGTSPQELAQALGTYATRVLTPRGTIAVCGLELMTALRPPTRAVWDEAEQRYVSGPVPGSLTRPVDPAPPEAPEGHPLAVGRPAQEPAHAVNEEDFDWMRDPEALTDEECALPHAVGLDVSVAFLAAANRLNVGLGAPEEVTAPRFNKRIPGCWLVDLSHIDLGPRLPSPFTPTGERPTGPGWYETPTLAYAEELGYEVHPTTAWLYRESGGYLDPWYQRLSAAYLSTMADLGVTRGMPPADFLTAMEHHKDTDPAAAAVLDAIKHTAKGGIGKLAETAMGRGWRPGQPWSALERPTWRPHIRYTLIATARMWMHRRLMRMAEHGYHPLGVRADCVVYASPGPSPLDLLPLSTDGTPVKGVFPLGPGPGQVKHEGTRSLLWAVEQLDTGANPARYIKGTDADADGE